MTAAMPGYGADLPDELVLGHIAWYTITKPQVTQPEMAQLVTDLNLSPRIIPIEPRPGDAFKRACRYSERSGLDYPLSNDKANFLIRSVTTNHDEIERHLVLERVDATGKHLDYTIAAHLNYNRVDDAMSIMKVKLPKHLDELVVETLNMFGTNFEEALKYIDAQVIRRMIREQLEIMGAIAIRKQGSVYFVPMKEKERTLALEKFCQNMGVGSVFHSIPLPDTTKQREMIHAAFEEEVHQEAAQAITELRKLRAIGEPISSKAWAKYRDQLNRLRTNYDSYGSLVNTEMIMAKTELKALSTHLTDFMQEGLVKA